MKKRFLLAILLFGAVALNTAQAQFHLSVNIGTQPVWGPVGYDHAENYYLPDIGTYYNVDSRQYTYQENGKWVTRASLPPRYSNYNLYTGHKVVVNESKPYLRDNVYRTKYASFKNKHDQTPIRDSKDKKYFENKDHPMHSQWHGNDNKGRGH